MAKQENLEKGIMNLAFEVILTCRQTSRHGADSFISEGSRAADFIVFKNPSPRLGLNTRTFGRMASKKTTRPQRPTTTDNTLNITLSRVCASLVI
jgi:hypothetical protein